MFLCGKSSKNSSKPVLILWSSIPLLCTMYVYTLIKVVSYYDFSILSMSKKSLDGGGGGWGEVYPIFSLFFLIFF